MNFISMPLHIIDRSTFGFGCGWLAGTATIAAGKIYTILLAPEKRVSELLGHYGKSSFRRELCVAGTMAFCAREIFRILAERFQVPQSKLTKSCEALLLGIVATASYRYVGRANYDMLKIIAVGYSILKVGAYLLTKSSGWAEPNVLSKNSPEGSTSAVAVDPKGNSVALYVQHLNQEIWLMGSTKTSKGDWSNSVPLSPKISDANDSSITPSILMDRSGNATALWSICDGKLHSIQGAVLAAGSSLWQPLEAYPTRTLDAWPPFSMDVDENGNVLVVWQTENSIHSALLKKGATKLETLPVIRGGGNIYNLQFKVVPSGRACILWTFGSFNLDCGQLAVSSFSPETKEWSKPYCINSIEKECWLPSFSVDANGNALAVWQVRTDTIRFEALYYNVATKNWEKTDFSNVTGITSDFSTALTFDPSGSAVLVYQPDGTHVYTTMLAFGSRAWSKPVQVSKEAAYHWKTAVDTTGNRVIAWVDYKDKHLEVATLAAGHTDWKTWTQLPQATSTWPLGDVQLSNDTAVVLCQDKGGQTFSVTGSNLFK